MDEDVIHKIERSKRKINDLLRKIHLIHKMCPCIEQFVIPKAISDIEHELDILKSSYVYDDLWHAPDTISISESLFAESLTESVVNEYREKLRVVKRLYDNEPFFIEEELTAGGVPAAPPKPAPLTRV